MLFRSFLPPEQLGTLTIDDIVELARAPGRFQLPDIANQEVIPSLAAAWEVAEQAVAAQDAAAALRQEQVAGDRSASKLNRITMEIIRGEPITVGDRHRLIYSAARNLAAAGATLQLTQDLLVRPARDAGLPPRDVERQIRCGFSDGAIPNGAGGAVA